MNLALATALLVAVACAAGAEWWRYPPKESIEVAHTKGDPVTIQVDKQRQLPADYVPGKLVILEKEVIRTTREIRILDQLVDPLRELNKAATEDGIDLAILSGYRSFETQREVYASWLQKEGGDQAATDKFSARPGHSEHQLGTAVDFTTSEIANGIGPRFNHTKAAKWLHDNAGRFGFRLSYPKGKEHETGYMHEGWHWRFWGEAAEARPPE